ncbi:MAG: HDOD domain-containing protein [Deltaproteobacteria bacterium]|nr:HDOD domain-containing protein [Deltaproteobacteria bacterium]
MSAPLVTRRRVLFVDDEPHVLHGLRDLLRSQRGAWEMHFADGGEAALALMERTAFDVVVSDMRMPGMDGSALLKAVQARSPRSARIILSGHADMASAIRAVPIAHQFLSKPCNPAHLKTVVQRACDLQNLLQDETLRERMGEVSTLPSVPRTYQALTQALMDPGVSARDVAGIVESDVALAARVLHVVNSAFFGLARPVTSVQEAVAYLGLHMIRSLALSLDVFHSMRGGEAAAGFDPNAFQRHALATAAVSRRLLTQTAAANDAFTAGLLHDIGDLVAATRRPAIWSLIHATAAEEGIPPWAVEVRQHGFSHAEEGAYLLGLWGLPYPIVEAVAFHHDARRLRRDEFGVAEAVHVGAALATAHLFPGDPAPGPDPEWLAAAGMGEQQLEAWLAIAKRELGGVAP